MSYNFRDSDYINAIEFNKVELDSVTRSHVKPCDNPIDRRLGCLSIDYYWRYDVNGNKYKLGVVTLDNYQVIPIVGEHTLSYLSWFENYTGIERRETRLKPKQWHSQLAESMDYCPLYAINAFLSPLQ